MPPRLSHQPCLPGDDQREIFAITPTHEEFLRRHGPQAGQSAAGEPPPGDSLVGAALARPGKPGRPQTGSTRANGPAPQQSGLALGLLIFLGPGIRTPLLWAFFSLEAGWRLQADATAANCEITV